MKEVYEIFEIYYELEEGIVMGKREVPSLYEMLTIATRIQANRMYAQAHVLHDLTGDFGTSAIPGAFEKMAMELERLATATEEKNNNKNGK